MEEIDPSQDNLLIGQEDEFQNFELLTSHQKSQKSEAKRKKQLKSALKAKRSAIVGTLFSNTELSKEESHWNTPKQNIEKQVNEYDQIKNLLDDINELSSIQISQMINLLCSIEHFGLQDTNYNQLKQKKQERKFIKDNLRIQEERMSRVDSHDSMTALMVIYDCQSNTIHETPSFVQQFCLQ